MFSGESFGLEVLGWLATVFIFVVGLFMLFLIVVYISDVTQTKRAIIRNYPVIAHLRYYFEHIGTFFRQYFFPMDREEMLLNHTQRSWLSRASKGIYNMVAFGSRRDLKSGGITLFVNTAFPTLCIGANFITSALGLMFSLGCIQALQCHKNTCPTGITKHNKKLQRELVSDQKSTRVAKYIKNINYEMGVTAHSSGVRSALSSILTRHAWFRKTVNLRYWQTSILIRAKPESAANMNYHASALVN